MKAIACFLVGVILGEVIEEVRKRRR